MGFPAIEATDVGNSGLFWLFLSYGAVLFYSSNLISDGSELLLLVPSLAGLVGSCVLPVLGAVPDGAIMAFSGMGDLETAQDTLAVGVGALAGSTIMLLTVPWGLSIFAGKVDIVDGVCDYSSKTGKVCSHVHVHGHLHFKLSHSYSPFPCRFRGLKASRSTLQFARVETSWCSRPWLT